MNSNITKTETHDLAYLGEDLGVTPIISLLDDGHPVTDKLVGKAITLNFEGVNEILEGYFVDQKTISWNFGTGANKDTEFTNPYVAFEIAENVFFLTWAEAAATSRNSTTLHEGTWHVTFILDLNKMLVTDSYINPDDNGASEFNLAQGRVSIKDMDAAV